MTASITRRASFPRSFVFVLINLRCICLMSKFSETSLLVYRKIFSAFYLILHEDFSNRYGFPLTEQFNLFSPHLELYVITMESRITGGVGTYCRQFLNTYTKHVFFFFFQETGKQAHIPYTIQYKKTKK